MKNFKYLDDLIHDEKKEVVLEHDIVLDKGEESEYEDGISLNIDDLVIDGNGHTIDALGKTRIFNCSGKNITIKNMTLKNGYGVDGGAILNRWGMMEVINCCFENNTANFNKIKSLLRPSVALLISLALLKFILDMGENLLTSVLFSIFLFITCLMVLSIYYSTISPHLFKRRGGAIYNKKKIYLYNCRLIDNNARQGDAIFNDEYGVLELNKTTIENHAFNKNLIISEYQGELSVFDCEFLRNSGSQNIIKSKGDLTIEDGIFRENHSKNIIRKDMNSKGFGRKFDGMDILRTCFMDNYSDNIIFNDSQSHIIGKFIENKIKKSVIYNKGPYCGIEKSIFENNLSYHKDANNVINKGDLTFMNPKINDDGKTILNDGHILIKSAQEDFESKIYGKGDLEMNIIPEGTFDFGYLDRIIHESITKEITLKEDICLENYEIDFYEGGIELDIDDLIIDGNGKTIDGAGKSRIFLITGKNITLKNITFKNGKVLGNLKRINIYNSNGGAIQNNSLDLKISDCTFLNNHADNDGGAIENTLSSSIIISNCNFLDNASSKLGGAICNVGHLKIEGSIFKGNIADRGGAACNFSKLIVENSTFEKNRNRDLVKGTNSIYGPVDLINCHFKRSWGAREHMFIYSASALITGILFFVFYFWGGLNNYFDEITFIFIMFGGVLIVSFTVYYIFGKILRII